MDAKERQLTPEQAITLWKSSMLSVKEDYEQECEVLKVDGICFGTLGNFSASIGKAKSKKTFNVSAMVAAAISGKRVLNYTTSFPPDKGRILYVDTEQSSYHCQKVMRRILRLADLSPDEDCARLQFLALRKFTPEERMAIIETAIYNTEGLGFVVIDGVRDLLYDINASAEATSAISKLMKWTEERQIHLHTILHQNKSDENARGHIGTELNNKAETVMQVEKDKTDAAVSSVEAVHIRSMDFAPFAFRINDEALPELVEDYVPATSSVGRPKKAPFDPAKDIPAVIHEKVLDIVFSSGGPIGKYADFQKALVEAYRSVGCQMNANKAVDCIRFFKESGMVTNGVNGYFRNAPKIDDGNKPF